MKTQQLFLIQKPLKRIIKIVMYSFFQILLQITGKKI